MLLSEQLQTKWATVIDHPELPKITDPYRKAVTAVILENQAQEMQKQSGMMMETAPTNSLGGTGYSGGSTATGPVAGFDPILISLVRRSLPNLIAYDIAGVQPMTGPTGLIFAMRSTYGTNRDVNGGAVEAFYNEANTGFSGDKATQTAISMAANTALGNQNVFASTVTTGGAMATSVAEDLTFNEMGFSIEKVSVTAKSRALKAEYSMELAQDLKAVHGLDAETELANILSTEILAEINREVIGWLKRLKVWHSNWNVKPIQSLRQPVVVKVT